MTGILTTTILSFILYFVIAGYFVLKNKKYRGTTFKAVAIIFATLFIIGAIIVYIFMPPITIPNMTIANIIIGVAGMTGLYMLTSSQPFSKSSQQFDVITGAIIVFTVIAIPGFFVLGIFTLDDTYESIAKEEVAEAKPLDKDATPIVVSPEFARNKVQKAMSVVPNTQYYDLGKLQVQKIKDDIVFVAPVEFTDFWRYFRGKETEGYFTISATDVNAQPKFIKNNMKYTNSSYFHHNIDRTIYNAHPDYIRSGEAQIEVDENGKPWYVQTLFKPIGLTNKPDMEKLHVAVVDPVTGDVKLYHAADAPEFIDGSISSEMASNENEYFGKYIHGWLNSLFGKKDVKIPNESGTESSVTPIFDENGEMHYFTDMSSPKENIDSALGYTLINARTGELTYYNGEKNNGIMDSKGAKEIVNKEFPEKKWTGSMPILYNIDGNPTWVVNVLDPNGLFKHYAYIKASDSDFVVFGDTARSTLEAYRLALAQDPSNVESTGEAALEKRNGIVERVVVTTQDKKQIVQFLLKDDATIYTVNSGKAPRSIFLQIGDKVQLEANMRDNQTGIVETISIEGLTE
ncbi:MAG: DNA-binding protein [Bacillota bacterium]|uniref:DNA-binding protein n=1 Tax=Virgibacillus salarius TaxID=447199 RepID=A0A941DTH3_9BACI|nr:MULTISPECIES: DNA-binding protein [Bacillaceae]MBR7795202.1 DNA-binding protein [Virgibacillus salarius]NAZ07918.1 DNA-binding protein [Agaribacter marinus]WBX80402.1 DNA-binding protein [Virgibacillus salarius]